MKMEENRRIERAKEHEMWRRQDSEDELGERAFIAI